MVVSLKNIRAVAIYTDIVFLTRHLCEYDSPLTLLPPQLPSTFPAHLLMLLPIQADRVNLSYFKILESKANRDYRLSN